MVMLRMVVGEDAGDCRKCWSACGGGGGGRRAGEVGRARGSCHGHKQYDGDGPPL